LLPPAETEAGEIRKTAGSILVIELLWELRYIRRILTKVFSNG
jgi:hypothetical protein